MLARLSTHPGLTSGWATYTLKLQQMQQQLTRNHGGRQRCRLQVYKELGWTRQNLKPIETRNGTTEISGTVAQMTNQCQGEGRSRIEGDKDSLIKNHGTVAIRHADLTVWRVSVNDFCRGHIAGVECCF